MEISCTQCGADLTVPADARLVSCSFCATSLVVADEVRKPDMLASVNVGLETRAFRLAATPFAREGEWLRCAVTGQLVRAEE